MGDRVEIANSYVEYCVIMEGAKIVGVERLEESLVERNAKVIKESARGVTKLHVVDYSEVYL